MAKSQVKNIPWTQEEDQILRKLIEQQIINFEKEVFESKIKRILNLFNLTILLQNDIISKSAEEINHNWTQVAAQLAEMKLNYSFRNAKQIRERWNNYLNPILKKSMWEEGEDILLLKSTLSYGKKWSQISSVFGSRTESQVKNRYNSIINKLKKQYGKDITEESLIKMEIYTLQNKNVIDQCSKDKNFSSHIESYYSSFIPIEDENLNQDQNLSDTYQSLKISKESQDQIQLTINQQGSKSVTLQQQSLFLNESQQKIEDINTHYSQEHLQTYQVQSSFDNFPRLNNNNSQGIDKKYNNSNLYHINPNLNNFIAQDQNIFDMDNNSFNNNVHINLRSCNGPSSSPKNETNFYYSTKPNHFYSDEQQINQISNPNHLSEEPNNQHNLCLTLTTSNQPSTMTYFQEYYYWKKNEKY